MSEASRPQVLVVTGLSGAGKTTVLHTLEDLGYFCVDNLPTMLASQAVRACESGGMLRVALGIDVRVRSFLATLEKGLGDLEDGGKRDVHIVFLDASDEALLRRFSESRRPHPLARPTSDAHQSALAVLDGVRIERERLAPFRAKATRLIDTTHFSVHDLRRAVLAQFGPASGGAPRMLTRLLSFGFKYGLPVDADLVLDVRFLDNPYFVPALKELPGTDPAVRSFVLALPETTTFLEKTYDLLQFMLPRYAREGKSYLTIAIGCTGGRHRSVVVAEALEQRLGREGGGGPLHVVHRDVHRADRAREIARAAGGEEPFERFSHSELKGVVTPPPPPPEVGAIAGGGPNRGPGFGVSPKSTGSNEGGRS